MSHVRIHTEGERRRTIAALQSTEASRASVTRGRPRGQAAGIVSMRMGECGVLVVHAPSLAEGEASRSVVCTACACGNSTG